MECIREVSDDYANGQTYLLDGTKLIAYVKAGDTEAVYFSKPIQFSKRYRKFVPGDKSLFKRNIKSAGRQVLGSKPGVTYTVDDEKRTCTCPGFQFRGTCKHLERK